MLRNYFKILIRNLVKNKAFSIINILGLTIGMASAILIILWIQQEYSVDKFHEKGDRLYAVYNREDDGTKKWVNNSTPRILGKTLMTDFPEVEAVTRHNGINRLFSVGENKLNAYGIIVDSTFLNMFSFKLLEGEVKNALNNPKNIVLTESFAKTLFGKKNAMGQTIKIDTASQFTVSGILKDLPNNTDFSFKYLLPISYAKTLGWENDKWGNNSTTTYLLLKEGVSATAFEDKIKNITKDNTKNEPTPLSAEVFLHPLEKLHLYNKNVNGYLEGGEIKKVRMFSVIAGFILLIACINFMNLSTAKSEKRAKEVGIRKVVGVRKNGLILQFIFESLFLATLSFLIALVIAYLVMPFYNNLINSKLSIPVDEPYFWLFSAVFIVFTGLLAGSYPAFYLSSFNPVKVLKGTFQTGKNTINARKILVVVQFTFAITLIISTVIIYNQIRYGLDREVGYDRSQLIYIPLSGKSKEQYQTIKNELLNSGAVTSMTKNSSPITQRWSDQWALEWDGSTKEDAQTSFITMGSDADLVKTMGLQLVQGRDIDIDKFPSDSNAMLINESALKAMHLKDPVGKLIYHVGYREYYYKIVGVVKDFVLESPFMDQVNPVMIMGPIAYFPKTAHLKLSDRYDTKTSLGKIEAIFKKFKPDYPFEFTFVDESFALKFASTERTAKLVTLFSSLTILISCLGLFGLAAYMAENRTKEIGIRKVLGASAFQLSRLLTKEFLILIGIAFLIASPIAWYIMNQWMKDYSYNSGISWWVFALTGVFATLITLLTIGWQTVKAALTNPVKSLRNE